MLLTFLSASAYNFCVDGIYYNITDNTNHEVEVTSNDDLDYHSYSGVCTIPEVVTYNGIQYSVTSIGGSAFWQCTSLTAITIPNSVTSIGYEAFRDCTSLASVTIPNSVNVLGTSAFDGCNSLESVSIGTGIPELPSGVFSGCSALSSITIPNNILQIGDYAFWGCTSLADIFIENGANEDDRLELSSTAPLFSYCPLDEVYIGRKLSYETGSDYSYSPFYRNTTLRTVEISDAETEIYDNEFYGCSNLKTLKIGDGVTTIGNWAFSGCSSLDYFSVGSHVETIGQGAFSECTALTKFYSYAPVPPVCGNQALDYINKWECTLYVPQESIEAYKEAPQWREFFFMEGLDGIDEVSADVIDCTAAIEVYNLNGVKVSDTVNGLPTGIYIVRQGSNVQKISVK